MNDILMQGVEHPSSHMSYIHELFEKAEGILHQHRHENPDLYRMVEDQKVIKEANEKKAATSQAMTSRVAEKISVIKPWESIYFKQSIQKQLKAKIRVSHQIIRENNIETQSLIAPRTQARNAKQSYCSVEEMTADRSDKLSSQIQAWKS